MTKQIKGKDKRIKLGNKNKPIQLCRLKSLYTETLTF